MVGAGLAGLSAAFELTDRDRRVLVLEAGPVVGGRTASWDDRSMRVESGLHRVLGFYAELPALLRRAGCELDRVVHWEDEVEIRTPEGVRAVLGASPLHKPLKTLLGPLARWDLLSPLDLASLAPFFAAGLATYLRTPHRLDQWALADYARHLRVTDRALRHLLVPLSAGIFFLPPERYSAANFFGLFAPALPRVHQVRLGAFLGGMTDVMCQPIADAITARGGEVRTGVEVTGLEVVDGAVTGVRTAEGVIHASNVVLATDLGNAQRLLRPALGGHAWFARLLAAPTTPSVTVQFELDRPSTEVDRTTFGPGTVLASFSEQSRTTFPSDGRLSVILESPERFLHRSDEEIAAVVVGDAARIGLDLAGHVRQHRVVRFHHDFLSLEPGHLRDRPGQRTPVPGLVLAGDYTRQRFLSSMEGAVVSGRAAARIVDGET